MFFEHSFSGSWFWRLCARWLPVLSARQPAPKALMSKGNTKRASEEMQRTTMVQRSPGKRHARSAGVLANLLGHINRKGQRPAPVFAGYQNRRAFNRCQKRFYLQPKRFTLFYCEQTAFKFGSAARPWLNAHNRGFPHRVVD